MRRALVSAAGYARGGYEAASRAGNLSTTAVSRRRRFFGLSDPARVIFTLNATHALNLAIHALVRPGAKLAVSGFEHNAVMRPLALRKIRPVVLKTPLWEPETAVQSVKDALADGAEIFILNHVSNVFGYALPLDEIAPLLTEAGVPLILDASQSAGVVPLDVSRYPCLAAVCMPGHKALYGPMGTGVLLALDERLASRPLMAGGTGSRSEEMAQPDFLPDAQESGTPNVPGLAGLAAGIRFVRSVGPENILAHERPSGAETARALEGNGLLEVFSNPCADRRALGAFPGHPGGERRRTARPAGNRRPRRTALCAARHRTAGTEQTGTVRLSFGFYSTAGQAEQAAKAFKLVKKL